MIINRYRVIGAMKSDGQACNASHYHPPLPPLPHSYPLYQPLYHLLPTYHPPPPPTTTHRYYLPILDDTATLSKYIVVPGVTTVHHHGQRWALLRRKPGAYWMIEDYISRTLWSPRGALKEIPSSTLVDRLPALAAIELELLSGISEVSANTRVSPATRRSGMNSMYEDLQSPPRCDAAWDGQKVPRCDSDWDGKKTPRCDENRENGDLDSADWGTLADVD